MFADSNKTISDVLTEFQDGGCLAHYDQNGVSVSSVIYYPCIGVKSVKAKCYVTQVLVSMFHITQLSDNYSNNGPSL